MSNAVMTTDGTDYDSLSEVTYRVVSTGEIKHITKYEAMFMEFKEPVEILSWGNSEDFFAPNFSGIFPVRLPDRFHNDEMLMILFQNKDLTNTDLSNIDLSNLSSLRSLFSGSILNETVGKINVSGCSDFSYIFNSASGSFDLSDWDVSSGIYFDSMFDSFQSTTVGDISKWDVSKATSMKEMFKSSKIKDLDLSGWDVSSIIGVPFNFADETWPSEKLPKWDVPSNVKPGKDYFTYETSNQIVKYVKLGDSYNDGDIYKLLDWGILPEGTKLEPNYFRLPVVVEVPTYFPKWLTSMQEMFYFSSSSSIENLDKWDVGHVINFKKAFEFSVANPNVENWDVSSGVDFTSMFYACMSLNRDLSKWNTKSALHMESMFGDAYYFNSDLSGWDVRNIPEKPEGFDDGTYDWVLPRPIWGTTGGITTTPPEEKPTDPEEPLRVGMIRCLDGNGKIVDVTITKGVVIIPDGVRVVLDWGYVTPEYMESLK